MSDLTNQTTNSPQTIKFIPCATLTQKAESITKRSTVIAFWSSRNRARYARKKTQAIKRSKDWTRKKGYLKGQNWQDAHSSSSLSCEACERVKRGRRLPGVYSKQGGRTTDRPEPQLSSPGSTARHFRDAVKPKETKNRKRERERERNVSPKGRVFASSVPPLLPSPFFHVSPLYSSHHIIYHFRPLFQDFPNTWHLQVINR